MNLWREGRTLPIPRTIKDLIISSRSERALQQVGRKEKENAMSAQRFVVKKIGEKYVPVPQEVGGICAAWTAGGALLAGMGLLHRGFFGLLGIGFGAGMVYRGMTGRNPLNEWFGDFLKGSSADTGQPSYQHDFKRKAAQKPQDDVDEAVMESFPASDPPARTATTAPAP